MKRQKPKPCEYPDCSNHKPGSKGYCCAGCQWDHHDWLESRAIKEGHPNEVEPEVSIDDKYVEFAECWFLRCNQASFTEEDMVKWYGSTYVKQMWLCLFNGAFLSTDKDTGPRYAYEKNDWGDGLCFEVLDKHTLSMDRLTDSKYLVVAKCYKEVYAKRIVKALNHDCGE